MRKVVVLCVAAAALVCGTFTRVAAIDYTIRDLGVAGLSVANDINNKGEVVGSTREMNPLGPSKGFMLKPDGTSWVLLGATTNSSAYGVGELAEAVGAAGGGTHAMAWYTGGAVQQILLPTTMLNGNPSIARKINKWGQIVGSASNPSGNSRGVIWENIITNPVNLGNKTDAMDINDLGRIVGRADDHAAYWDPDLNMHQLADPTGSFTFAEALGISDQNRIVGHASSATSDKPVYWLSDGSVKELDTLSGTSFGSAMDVNSSGFMVGASRKSMQSDETDTYATLWNPDGTVQELPSLISGGFSAANAINKEGQIVGWAYDSTGLRRAVIWTPVPEPSTLILAALSGLGGLATLRRRRAAA